MQFRPVLIGSHALKFYGLDVNNHDTDIIVNKDLAKEILFNCNRKEGKMCFFGDQKYDLHLIENSAGNYKIFNCLNFLDNQRTEKIDNIGEIIIAPLEMLYIIKKSHIMRIIPATPSQITNINIWHKQMKYYIWIRNKLGYNKADEMLYGGNKFGPVIQKENEYEYMRDIYVTKFDEIITKFGDTKIDMNKSEEEFFEDNVKRYIPHDELHKMVAMKNRNTIELLFIKAKDENKANLSLEKFQKLDSKEKIEMIREELMVLLLERKWIPECITCGYTALDEEKRKKQMKEIIAHYTTNLCGKGDSWLRRYVLDHYEILNSTNDYNKMDSIVQEIINVDKEQKKGKTLDEFINQEYDLGIDTDVYFNNLSSTRKEEIEEDYLSAKYEAWYGPHRAIEYYEPYYEYNRISISKNDVPSSAIRKIYKSMVGSNLVIRIGDILYDLENNIGVQDNRLILRLHVDYMDPFYYEYASGERIYIKIEYYDTTKDDIDDLEYNFTIEQSIEYYHSDDCEWQQHREVTYLSSFGNLDEKFMHFVEFITRCCLHIDLHSYDFHFPDQQ